MSRKTMQHLLLKTSPEGRPLQRICQQISGHPWAQDQAGISPPAPTLWERLLLVLALVSSSILLAAVLPDLSVVFGLTGQAFCGRCLEHLV